MFTSPIIECVPNFSEGQNPKIIQAIASVIQAVEGVNILHIDSGYSANRTVITFAGSPDAVIEAAFLGIQKAGQLIDMRHQKGTHPRMGATDVCPLIPVANISMEELNHYALKLAQRVGTYLNIPVFLYESSARIPQRKNLATIRSGEYEGLGEKIKKEAWHPDFGPKELNEKSGATVIGVRNFLVAYNINLDTTSVDLAKEIAKQIRTSGYLDQLSNGQKVRVPGRLPALKAIGWYIEEFGHAQVSMNLVDTNTTGIYQAFQTCKEIANSLGVKVTGSELIGLIPLKAILDAGHQFAKKRNATHYPDKTLLDIAVKQLGLGQINSFNPIDRILELKLIAYGFNLKY